MHLVVSLASCCWLAVFCTFCSGLLDFAASDVQDDEQDDTDDEDDILDPSLV